MSVNDTTMSGSVSKLIIEGGRASLEKAQNTIVDLLSTRGNNDEESRSPSPLV